ncbi:MAG: GNAT family N-acetyltransferase [Alphaproteobacteria bacterium]|nr:GNAT family N-acetyltransferase [Alphaproteobacteria bacterium]
MSAGQTQPIEIRPAKAEDAAQIARLANALDLHEGLGGRVFTEGRVLRDGFGLDPAFGVLVAGRPGDDGRVLAYLLWHWAYDTDRALRKFWVSDIFVAEEARGQGIGGALLKRAEAMAREAGAGSIALAVREDNLAAIRFYEALGFAGKAVLMEKGLAPLP